MVRKRSCVLCKSEKNLFSFPDKEEEKKQWAESLGIEVDGIKPATDKVCIAHFTKDQLKYKKGKRLREGACPTILTQSVCSPSDRDNISEAEDSNNVRRKDLCIVCGYVSANAFFSFPRDILLKAQWAKFCGISLEKITSRSRLCNIHFTEDDFRIATGRKLLTRNSIPTLHPKLVTSKNYDLGLEPQSTSTAVAVPTGANVLESENFQPSAFAEIPLDVTVASQRRSQEKTVSPERAVDPLQMMYEELQIQSNETVVATNTEPSVDAPAETILGRTAPKRYFRYFGDIKEDDVVTPKRAKLALQMGKEKVEQCKKKISVLETTTTKLKRRIIRLQDIIGDLEKKNLITQHAAQTILVAIKN